MSQHKIRGVSLSGIHATPALHTKEPRHAASIFMNAQRNGHNASFKNSPEDIICTGKAHIP